MSRKEGRDYIYVIWKDPKSRRQYIIGELSKNGKYEFSYSHDINEAINSGFEALISFDDIYKKYSSDVLFSSFTSRLPDRKRKNINEILNKYGMNEYNEYELLKRSGGRLPIDNLEFIDPIFNTYTNSESEIVRYFWIAGSRHWIGCDGLECINSINVEDNTKLFLEFEPNNKYDKYAIKILNEDNEQLGYVPRYFSENLTKMINSNYSYECTVYEVNKMNNCNECIRVKLKLNINNKLS